MAHKRQTSEWEPPRKRHQSENGHRKVSNGPDFSQSSSPPEPPKIGAQYESQVFTHMSALGAEDSCQASKSYEQLEFLGDAYIELFASRLILKKFPNLPAGKMSQLRENLVKNETLAEITCTYGFDTKFRGATDLQRNPSKWTKVKGDILEAYVAAVILSDPDKGEELAEEWLVKLWTPLLALGKDKQLPDMRSKVQLLGKIGGKRVKVNYVEERDPVFERGDQVFFMGAYLTGWGWDNQHLGSGKGTNKAAAGNDAAAKALLNTALMEEIMAAKKAGLAEVREDVPKQRGEQPSTRV
jgi:ribonuclease-3